MGLKTVVVRFNLPQGVGYSWPKMSVYDLSQYGSKILIMVS